MKIAVLAHIRYPIAEPFRGGMEAHCRGLCNGLRAAGHEVTLFAAQGSQDEQLVPICPAPYDDVLPWDVWRGTPELFEYQRAAFAKAREAIAIGGYDVVHNNSLFTDAIAWFAADGVPCVTSQHVPPFGTMRDAVRAAAPHPQARFTVTSASQLHLWDADCRTRMAAAPNGIDTDAWQPCAERGDHFTWVGRVVPNKGLAEAVAAARIAGVKLQIYGPIEDAAYFADRVEPLLSEGIEYRGHARTEDLCSAIGPARAALVTPMWDEPFGLVAAEALACGVPVVAFDRGAMREVIGDCGIVVPPGDVAALAEAMRQVGGIDRTACRARAVRHLSIEAMIRRYEEAYAAAVAGSREAAMLATSDTVMAASTPALARSSSQPSTVALLA